VSPEEDKTMPHKKLSRNAPCPCGSGKKYKHCCYGKGVEDDLALRSGRQQPPYPLGTVALYGPDDKTTTKIAAWVILQAGQRLTADHEHGHPGDACLLVGVPEGLLMRLSIFPGPQGLLEPLLVQPDLAGQPGQHVDPADVLPCS
jgi:hypothetical protein